MSKIDEQFFFAYVRNTLFQGKILNNQFNGMKAILKEWDARTQFTTLQPAWLAYMFATVYHETDQTMQPIEEYGKGRGKKYGEPDPETNQIYYGRGFVQLTWKENYQKATNKIGQSDIDLVKEPELALELDIATIILFDGMIDGWFTGKGLRHYINMNGVDYRNARRIINGVDRAEEIAEYAQEFREAIA